jgi:malonyl-CoA/methylmalonyl-CoA synthetase
VNQNLYLQLVENLTNAPEEIFMITEDRTITRGEFLRGSRRIAQRLGDLELDPGSRVMVQVEKSAEAVMLYVACLQSGLVLVPLNTTYTPNEVGYFLSNAQPDLLVCAPENLHTAGELARQCGVIHVETLGPDANGTLVEELSSAPERTDVIQRSVDDLAAILYTSGTTGRPKGAMLSHGNLASNSRTLSAAWKFSSGDRLIHALPIFHTHGLFVACNVTMTAGASMHFLPRFDADLLIDLMADSTVLMGVPTFYSRLLQSQRLDRESTGHMRLFVSGSAPLQVDTHSAFLTRTGHAILERYGMTETNMNTSNPYDGKRKAGTVGPALPGIEIRIVDRESGKALPHGEPGMVEVRGPNVFQGYWRMPEKTASEFRPDGYFITGDLGVIDPDGYLQIVGRDKDLVISGGLNVYPREVEQALEELPEILESAVIGLPHPDLGEAVTAVVVLHTDAEISSTRIDEHLAGRIARYKQPKRILTVESFPRNAMGKIKKNELRNRFADTYADQTCHS